jgi:thiamine biosynthesis protein ThiI
VAPHKREIVVVHYNEIALKLGHRRMFTSMLVDNLRRSLADLPFGAVTPVHGRVLIEPGAASVREIVRRARCAPGVANVRDAVAVRPDIEALEAQVAAALETWRPRGSFRVDARRVDKRFPIESPEVARRIGAMIEKKTGATVNLKNADSTVYVLIMPDEIYLSFEKQPACGGLPVGTGGRVLLLLSGGIDSPVAGLRMLRRGCRVDALHFHSVPYLSRTSREKAEVLASVLARGQVSTRMSSVAFGDIQSEIVRSAPRPLRVVLYRRMMMRIASRIAARDGAAALVTGESLGQVASQTLKNLAAIEAAASKPVLRPLVGMDKGEITDYARREGTYEVSIVPDQDCCTLFVPKHPVTAAELSEVEAAEKNFDCEGMVDSAVRAREKATIDPDWNREPASVAQAIG